MSRFARALRAGHGANDGAANSGKTLDRAINGMADRVANAFHCANRALGRVGRVADSTDESADVLTDFAADRVAEGFRAFLCKIFGGAEH